MRSRMFHLRACAVPQTETRAPVSARGLSIHPLTTTGALKSLERFDLSFGNTWFLDDLTRKMFMSYVFSSCCCVVLSFESVSEMTSSVLLSLGGRECVEMLVGGIPASVVVGSVRSTICWVLSLVEAAQLDV